MEERIAVPQEISFYELWSLELLNSVAPERLNTRDYTLLGIHRYYLLSGDWETPLRKGMCDGDPLAARFMALIAFQSGDRQKAKKYRRYAKRLSLPERSEGK